MKNIIFNEGKDGINSDMLEIEYESTYSSISKIHSLIGIMYLNFFTKMHGWVQLEFGQAYKYGKLPLTDLEKIDKRLLKDQGVTEDTVDFERR